MPFDWNEIQNNWLYNYQVSHTVEEIITAFNKVERRFGSDVFDKYQGIRGQYIVNLMVDLCKILEEAQKRNCKLPEKTEIIKKIQSNNIESASTIIRLAAHYLRQGFPVEFEPELPILRKHPDLRIKINKKWIYIEESRLDFSLQFKLINKMMNNISSVLELVNSNLYIEVLLLKDRYSDDEINLIKAKIKNLADIPNQPQKFGIENFIQIFTYVKEQEKPSMEEIRPALGMASLSVGPIYERHLNIQIPFTDVRINKILTERKQLSPEEYNMIILDISISGNLKAWSESITKMFQTDEDRRIGGILLVCTSLFIDYLKISSSLIEHSNPLNPLPREFIQTTKDYFKEPLKFSYRPDNTS